MKNTNWQAMQSYKGQDMGKDIKPKYVAMGSWHANLAKGGNRVPKSSGGAKKR